MVKNYLLIIHITGGSLAILSASAAVVTQALQTRHRGHVIAGRLFVAGMSMVVVSAVPLAVFTHSVFLGLVAVFSAYLMLSGWRFAKNRRGTTGPLDWAIPITMLAVSVIMIGYGAFALSDDGAVVLIFGLTGGGLALVHIRRLRSGPIRGRARISNHLVWMLAAFIAASTAFFVVNSTWGRISWLLPILLIAPIIVIWSRTTLAGQPTTLEPQASTADPTLTTPHRSTG